MERTVLLLAVPMVLVALGTGVGAASPSEDWNTTYGGDDADAFSSVVTTDDGYALSGYTRSEGEYDAWVMEVDAHGREVWNVTFGSENDDFASSLVETEDGYAVAGRTNTSGPGTEAWLVKLNSRKTIEWRTTFGDDGSRNTASSVVETEDGYVVGGNSQSRATRAWLVNVDENGTVGWNTTFEGEVSVGSVIRRDGYVVSGYTVDGDADAWIGKVDEDGDVEWNATYDNNSSDFGGPVTATRGGYAVGGYTGSFVTGNYDAWLVKVDGNGTEEWNATYGTDGSDLATSMAATEGGYALAGYTGRGNTSRGWLIETDVSGNETANVTFGGDGIDVVFSTASTEDGYVLAGYTTSFGEGSDAWLVKLGSGSSETTADNGSTSTDSGVDTGTARGLDSFHGSPVAAFLVSVVVLLELLRRRVRT